MAKNRVLTEGCFDFTVRRIVDQNFPDVSLATAQVDVTASTVLVNATGMTTDSLSLSAAGTYRFRVNLSTTAGASGGIKVAFKQSVASMLTSMECVARGFTASAVAVQRVTSATDAASLFAQTAAVINVELEGVFVTALPGSIQLQFAQNASDAAATSVFVSSQMMITRVA